MAYKVLIRKEQKSKKEIYDFKSKSEADRFAKAIDKSINPYVVNVISEKEYKSRHKFMD